jgi:nicotinamide-nucleotide amidase
MDTTLVLTGYTLYGNRALREAVERALHAKHKRIKAIHCLDIQEGELIDGLRHILQSSEELCIAASRETFAAVGKILATIKLDSMSYTDDIIHPASVSEVKSHSYLLQIDGVECNVLRVSEGKAIPEILLGWGDPVASWQLFGERSDLEWLRQHALDNGYSFEYVQQTEGWYEIHLGSTYRIDRLLPNKPERLLFPSANIFDTCIEILSGTQQTLTFAESCTGGLIASSFTARSGASDILKGSVVSYANEIKEQWLGVDRHILEEHGAVSRECVEAMAVGVRRMAQSDIALAVSGIAGPTGGTALKPVGTVYIAVADTHGVESHHLHLQGDRNAIQYQSMMAILKRMILRQKENFENFFKNS